MDQLTLRDSWNSRQQALLWLLWPLGFFESFAPWGQSYYCLLNHRWEILLAVLGYGYLTWTGPLLISLSFLQRAESKNQTGLGLGLILRFGKAAESTGTWGESSDRAPLGLPLALSVWSREQLPAACAAAVSCAVGGASPLAHKPAAVVAVVQLHLLPNSFPRGVGKRKSQEVARPHTSNMFGRNPILTDVLTL